MMISAHPIIVAAAIGGLIALSALVIALISRSGGVRTVMIILAFICLIPTAVVVIGFNPWLVDPRFRTYRAFYKDIEVGMTREQVLAVMSEHYPAEGKRGQPKIMDDQPTSLGFFMNPEKSREPNCEGIFLTLESGRVTKKKYSRD